MILPDAGTLLPMIGFLLAAGAAIGVLAGLFGIGGGAISVPIFYEMFGLLGYADSVRMPLAVGTSLAVIIPTSITSARAHYARGTVDVAVLRAWVVPIVLGTLAGSVIAKFSKPVVFQLVFIGVATVNATKLLLGGQGWRLRDGLPGTAVVRLYGVLIGVLSSLMGIGGGALSNLFLTLHGVPIHRSVSTSAGVGLMIALPGTLGYVLAGWGKPDLPPDALGYVSVLTFALTIPMTLVTTRLGVRLAHALSRRALETAFGLFLLAVSARFLLNVI